MLHFVTVVIKNRKALKILGSMEEQNLLQIVSESQLKFPSTKKKGAIAFLKSYRDAQLGIAGKIKLKSAESLLKEL